MWTDHKKVVSSIPNWPWAFHVVSLLYGYSLLIQCHVFGTDCTDCDRLYII